MPITYYSGKYLPRSPEVRYTNHPQIENVSNILTSIFNLLSTLEELDSRVTSDPILLC